MKKACLTLILYLLSFYSNAQYNALISEDKSWVYYQNYKNHEDIRPAEESYFFLFFKGDTVIQDSTYNILYKQRFFLNTWYNSEAKQTINNNLQKAEVYGFFREDTISKKVFSLDFGMERLVYDFSLAVGDTFNDENSGFWIVDSVKNIILKDGTIARKISFSTENEVPVSFIEGIGSESGLPFPFEPLTIIDISIKESLLCYSKNEVNLFGECDYPEYLYEIPDYTPFDFENGIWLVKESAFYDNYQYETYFQYICEGVEMYKGNKYYKLYVYYTDNLIYPMEHFNYGTINKNYIGLINNYGFKQVKLIQDGNEQIIYDFNLNVGDTIKNGYGGINYIDDFNDEILIVNSMDYYKYCGQNYKVYFYNYGELIEGIGFRGGFLDPHVVTLLNVGKNTICYTETNNLKCNDCNLLNGIDEVNKVKIDVEISIDNNFINLSSEFSFQAIKLYDLNGIEIFSEHDIHSNMFSINKTEITSAYHLVICKIYVNNQVIVKKILIN